MEQRKIGGWQEVEKIDRVRHAHAQRHTSHQSNSAKSQEKDRGAATKNFPCVYLNKNTCSQKDTHETKGVLYKHICSAF